MANNFFRFKQFTVYQEMCGMKVGTDGVLLGAWCNVRDRKKVLDIGTGTGLIALMIAQRNAAVQVDALEIDADACRQATINFESSPWGDRLHVLQNDFTDFAVAAPCKYDLIVSNPPYFENSLKAGSQKRSQARHTDTLSYEDLLGHGASLLADEGVMALVFPIDVAAKIEELALKNGLACVRRVVVKGNPAVPPKRVLAEFARCSDTTASSSATELIVEIQRHCYSDDYIALTRDFYLKME